MVTKKDKYLAAAQKFLERGSLDKALVEFMRAVQEDQKDTRTWLRIAEIHVKRGDNEKATEVYLRTADLYVEQGFFQRAVAVYKNIIKLSPGFVEAYLKLADIYRQLGLLSDAVQQFEQAASVFQRSGRVKEAIGALRQIVEINPDQPVSRIKLAEAASQAGLISEAVSEFSRAGELLRAQGRMDEYLRVAERLLFHQPDDVGLAKEVARQYIDRNNARFALAKLQACFKVDPRDTETLEMLARAFEQLGQTAKTVSVLKELAKVYGDSGRKNERVGVYKRIAVLDPTDAEAKDVLSTRASYVPPPPAPAPPPPRAPVEPMRAPPVEPRAPAPEPPRKRREAAITFSEMAVPQFLQNAQPEPPAIEVAPPPSTAERLEIASGLLEPSPDEASAQVKRIIAEADTFVKYGLTERAADHLRKVFELQPAHAGALERLAALLLKLGRRAEAVQQLEVLAEQMALSQPEAAAGYARRALEIDPNSRRGRKVMEIVAGRSAQEDEFEELSSSLIQMETPEPEVGLEVTEDSDTSFEITEGESTSITPSIFTTATDPSLTPLDHQGVPEEISAAEPASAAYEAVSIERGRASEDPERTPANEFEQSERTTGDDGTYSAMFADLEQVDFFIDQGIPDEARTLLDDVAAKYPPSPLLDARRRRIAELEAAAAPGAVPVEAGASHGQDAGSISPKAMVAAGGEMDLESHRDLGIGYKDMGLFDAAIREFSLLVKDPRHEVFALTMIGECNESKGALADAVAFYKKALNRPAISDDEATALYYQLGSVFQTMSEANEALYFFEKVLKRDSSFRDVRRRIGELRAADRGAAAKNNR